MQESDAGMSVQSDVPFKTVADFQDLLDVGAQVGDRDCGILDEGKGFGVPSRPNDSATAWFVTIPAYVFNARASEGSRPNAPSTPWSANDST